ncbi:MAG: LON peptidase substrate-binding domain-containing protein, partial [Acidimicrobiales bacterium]
MSGPEAAALPVPMFPLGTVLFPAQPLPLHIFEPRYRQLTSDCLRGNHEFGVVLIERGHEVGGDDTRFSIGTVARISEAVQLPDGRWALLAVGGRRIGVVTWLPDDPYPVALVENLPERRLEHRAASLLSSTEGAVRRILAMAAELGEPISAPVTFTLDEDPHTALWQLCAVAPLTAVD